MNVEVLVMKIGLVEKIIFFDGIMFESVICK